MKAFPHKSPTPATRADEQRLYAAPPSFVDLLPWVEYLPDSQSLLLEDGQSAAAFFELSTIGTEGREAEWLEQIRDTLENALQDSFDELDQHPWVIQLYAQTETDWDGYLHDLRSYVQPRAQDSAFTAFYLRSMAHHLHAVSTPDGLFEDCTVTHLPWRAQKRRTRLVVYRRARGERLRYRRAPEAELSTVCERLTGSLANAGIRASPMDEAAIHGWLVRWFNPAAGLLGSDAQARRRFFELTDTDSSGAEDALASGTDFAQRLFVRQPRSDAARSVWWFDDMPHRVITVDRLRSPPAIGHLTGETAKGDSLNAVFEQLPQGTTFCLTLIVTPQDRLEAQLNHLCHKSVGDTLDSQQTREDVEHARTLIGRDHKLYRAAMVFYLRGRDLAELDAHGLQLNNALLNAGLLPVLEEDEVAPLNSYLRWLPGVFDPDLDKRNWYSQLMFAQHVANLAPVWGRSEGTGHPGITLFNRGGGLIQFDPLNPRDRQMNAHLFLFGPTGSGKSATLNNLLTQVTAIYRPRLFIVEAGNSFGLFAEFAQRLGLRVHRIKLAPGTGVSLAPFADAARLVDRPNDVNLGEEDQEEPDERDVLGELEITARLMITGGEDKEEQRLTRADRSLVRQSILDAAHLCAHENRAVLTEDIRNALRTLAKQPDLPALRRVRLEEMADAMDLFCQGSDGELFNRAGSPWPEADITLLDLATYAREGYSAQLSIAYLSLITTVNNLAERDQMLGRPIINVTDEGHIITKNPLLAPYVVKITKMWRKLGAWFWLATQNLDDLPKAAEPMLNMIEWWICLSMPPDEVEKIARFRRLTPAQKTLMRSARKETGKFSEGVILSKSMEVLFRAVPPSLYLALAMTEPEEKHRRHQLMQQMDIDELAAAIAMATQLDRSRGIVPMSINLPETD
ncbi:conjugative transfer ATPase, PFL_4706 family [Pseudomonas cedrina]|uniref:Conjugative transfer ATPase n=2 Tax=Pseudomonas cedrina TaxID=651740 RepID=A0A1V2K0K4_PSECE|nr:conjugative transfer ATPase [Pseudomonas cedrina]ONH50895.1 conjugative transfer ATPase [Pseudomonas cedrina subsp. cedrina]SDS62581.1 conjugative transfer ATPase, PFL_4706 family [Pseudomonas cedrina]